MRNLSEVMRFCPRMQIFLESIGQKRTGEFLGPSQLNQTFFLAKHMKQYENISLENPQQLSVTFSAICLCTFRSVQRWVGFLFTFDLTLIIMDLLIYLIYLLFVQRVSFGPTNIRNRLSPPAFEVGRSCPKRPWQMHWQSRRNHQSPVRPIRPFSEGMASGIKIPSDAGIWQKGL